MDEGLFKKHIIRIQKQKNSKKELILYIQEKTGIQLDEKMVSISKNKVTLQTSSVTRQKLFQKDIIKLLQEKGYQTIQ